jgi:hypothetical protein
MKTIGILLLAATLSGASLPAIQAEELRPVPPNTVPTNAPATPKFDGFVLRLQTCTGMFATAKQWLQVMKPALEELGYTKDEVKELKKKLSASQATLLDARRFSERWLSRHGEQLNPQAIFACLPHEAAPELTLATR